MLNIAYQCVAVPTFNCTVANCASCSAASTCSACLPGYQVNLGNCVAQQCSITNCLSCASNSSCSACLTGFQLVNNN
jgi:hypothetical protein